jgi:hypothetical protein
VEFSTANWAGKEVQRRRAASKEFLVFFSNSTHDFSFILFAWYAFSNTSLSSSEHK